ncbi:MAG: hypothetical protein Q7J72_04660 [Candidatus Omnitrophota bacterium]|nr:hypothetical protein [Candidatus Omnitrophota bacterium]
MQRTRVLFILYCMIIAYLLINTGIISDDYDAISKLKYKQIKNIFCPDYYFISSPAEYFTHYIWYRFFDFNNLLLINILKIAYIILCFYSVSKFFSIFLDVYRAYLASFLFIFFPSHDSTVFWFMGQPLALSLALYLFSFYLLHRDKIFISLFLALAASFVSYGSTPPAIALSALFMINKKYRKALIIVIPNILYIIYFILIDFITGLSNPRITEKLSIIIFIKQFVFQILTFVDAIIGPSMWLKFYYSFSQLHIYSVVIGAVFILILFLIYKKMAVEHNGCNLSLVASLIILLFCSFAMFAVTGRYPQLAFGLGNRTTIYGSLLVAYLLSLFPFSKIAAVVIFAAFFLTIVGISDHWKDWGMHQQKVIADISDNSDLRCLDDTKIIYVSGNQFSKYGPVSHIEFFSEDWVVGPVFKLALNRDIVARTLNKRHKYTNGYLFDAKYNQKVKIDNPVNIYDSEKNVFLRIDTSEINKYIYSLPSDNRHWLQVFDFKLIKLIAIKLMPRLKYAL